MLLVIDIGNTNIVYGLFSGHELTGIGRIETAPGSGAEYYADTLRSFLIDQAAACDAVTGIIMASVVPQLDDVLRRSCRMLFQKEPLTVDARTDTGMQLCYETPATLGADRIAVAVAAFERFDSAVIAIDMGTATTFDYVDTGGCYRGGAIAPGLRTAADALVRQTAKLPQTELEYPERVIGRSTRECLQSGIVAGYVCMVEGMIRKIAAESDETPRVIATGGLARFVAGHTSAINEVDDHLLLRGLKIIYDRLTDYMKGCDHD